jgi:CBS domain containing-hemolysin-like protein
MALLLFYLFLALGISFLCSIMESVLLSTSMPFIQNKEAQGKKSARLLKKYKTEVDRPLSAILSLNTVAHTVGAAGVGAEAVKVFGEVYFGVVSAVLTLLILVVTEIIPKTIGALYWRDLALVSAKIIRSLIIITYPLVLMSEVITRFISRNKKPQSVSREEIAMMTSLGEEEGIFEEHESKVITNMIRLKSIRIREIMTPRTVMTAADESMKIIDFYKDKKFLAYSRIPIYSDNLDNIHGYVLKDAILSKLAEDRHSMQLKELNRPFIIAYENSTVPRLFEQLLYKKEHIALVVDEYGGTSGLVTMEDIIETLLGLEIVDESDMQTDMQKAALERWQKKRRENQDQGKKDS